MQGGQGHAWGVRGSWQAEAASYQRQQEWSEAFVSGTQARSWSTGMPVASVYLDRQPNVIRSHHFIDGHDGLDIWQTQLVVSWQRGVHIALVLLQAVSKDSHVLQARVEALAQSRGHGVCCVTQKHCLQDTKDSFVNEC